MPNKKQPSPGAASGGLAARSTLAEPPTVSYTVGRQRRWAARLLRRSRAERLAVLAFAAVYLALLALMPGWRASDAPDADGYAMAPAAFAVWQAGFAARYGDREAVVRPPPGDVPVLARRFAFVPELELRAGQTYRLHLSASDSVHSAVLDGREVLLVPGRVEVLTVTPAVPGELALRCGEYCGIGHSRMRGRITVVP